MTTVRSTNPHDPSETVAEVPATPTGRFPALLELAGGAGRAWAGTAAPQRAVALTRAADDIAAEAGRLADLISREVGKPITEARGEVVRAERTFRYFAQTALFPEGDVLPGGEARTLTFTRSRPRGVVGLITPWNFPLAIPAWKLAPALAYGNAVVLKPSAQAVGTAEALAEILNRHLPPGVLVLAVGPGTGVLVAESAAISAVSFTGSTEVGRQVAAAVSARGCIAQAEMGGQNPTVVLADADVDGAIAGIVGSAFAYAGQKCTATSRIIVHEDVYEHTRDALVEAVRALVVLDPSDPKCQVGPVIDEAARDSALAAVAASSGRILTGGTKPDVPGSYLEPTLVEVSDADDVLATDEVFAPVTALLRARSVRHAVELANATPYGLSASLYTRDLTAALTHTRDLAAGMIRVNAPTTGLDHWAPFGGTKESSFGPREQGLAARQFYTESTTVAVSP
ncbi:aldehyde dehydrogenase family protein [Phaeacidiphilus oryzae]|uniref:aldehyde dehydrogenase family protein n=1 Tax=Phaeacidiphilus oryzae TaxID=348818 RepID=UPI00055E4EA6|nr:aldehyde dehydrogenase family protein [Phaeacidiphilus oryzae]